MRLESCADNQYVSEKIELSPGLYRDLRKIVFHTPGIIDSDDFPEESLVNLAALGLLVFHPSTGKYCVRHDTVADLYNNVISCRHDTPLKTTTFGL